MSSNHSITVSDIEKNTGLMNKITISNSNGGSQLYIGCSLQDRTFTRLRGPSLLVIWMSSGFHNNKTTGHLGSSTNSSIVLLLLLVQMNSGLHNKKTTGLIVSMMTVVLLLHPLCPQDGLFGQQMSGRCGPHIVLCPQHHPPTLEETNDGCVVS